MQSIFTEKSTWKDKVYINELYLSTDTDSLDPVTQVQAVCLTEDDQVVLYEHVDGWFGLPGGKVELGEDYQQALIREIDEETRSTVLECGVFAYQKSWDVAVPEKLSYNLRYWAIVRPEDKPLNDPAGKAVRRILVNKEEAIEKLNWGEKGKILIENALDAKHSN